MACPLAPTSSADKLPPAPQCPASQLCKPGEGADGRPSKQLRRKRIGAEEREERAGRKRSQCQVVVESRCPVEAVTEPILAQSTHWPVHLRKPFSLWARTPRAQKQRCQIRRAPEAHGKCIGLAWALRRAMRATPHDACLARKNVVSRHHARPARGGMPIAKQRADAARRGQKLEHASSAARSLSGGARPRSSGRPITSAARSPLRRSATRLRQLASARGLAAKRPGAPAGFGLRGRREIIAF